MARRIPDDTGATLVEFAIAAPVLVMILFGIIQFCLGLYAYNFVSYASREAARYAIVRGSSCTGMPNCGATQAEIQTYVQGFNYPDIKSNNINVTVTWLSLNATTPTSWTACAGQCNAPGNEVNVQVTYLFPLNVPFWKDSTINLSSSSQLVIYN